MTQNELKQTLETKFGIVTDNCYVKKSYIKGNEPFIGCFSKELDDVFYFYIEYDNKFYKLPKQENKEKFDLEDFGNYKKYQIPMSKCIEIKEPEPYKELEDANMSAMTVRDLAAILLKKPISNKIWLNHIIKENK